ncbi:MAG TPA: 4Fe-4S dicluster domain-containing protein, partial [Acidobacteriota bacterium]|nr:4Fe-4S dicluster domain-containing protein [Acidobacteriota bacterium]
ELSATTWRHVTFIERPVAISGQQSGLGEFSWLLMSDVCKHCRTAGCLEACPTGSIIRTEFDSVYVQPDICNGCGYCIVACPFGVIDRRSDDGRAWKCTLCYDRLRADMTPACAQVCPTESIQFGEIDALLARARRRVAELHDRGVKEAYLYGVEQEGTDGLNAFFLLLDRPEVYQLPSNPRAPQKESASAWKSLFIAAAVLGATALAAFNSASREEGHD